jgi:hypothetical protein
MPLRRYKCPACGAGLSRTISHPEWLSLKAESPKFRMPLLPILIAIVLSGLGLVLIHPALAMLAIIAAVAWLNWRYYSYLQCDGCERFYFGGQLTDTLQTTRPWTRQEVKKRAVLVSKIGGIVGLLFIVFYAIEQRTHSNCSVECEGTGATPVVREFKCHCTPASPPPDR